MAIFDLNFETILYFNFNLRVGDLKGIALSAVCLLFFVKSSSAFYNNSAKQILSDTTTTGHIKIHHYFEAGVICQLGKEYVHTYNSYEHTTTSTNNYLVGQYDRFMSFRFGHSVLLKNVVSTGITYGLDFFAQPRQYNFFIPILWHVSYIKPLTKKVGLEFRQRAGYSFYLQNKTDNPLMQYTGIIGGFTSETTAAISILTKHKNRFTMAAGYRLQQLTSKSIFYPSQALTQVGGIYATLPYKITEISNGFYNFLYVSLGVSF